MILRHLNYSQVAQGAHLFPGPDASAPSECSKEGAQSSLTTQPKPNSWGWVLNIKSSPLKNNAQMTCRWICWKYFLLTDFREYFYFLLVLLQSEGKQPDKMIIWKASGQGNSHEVKVLQRPGKASVPLLLGAAESSTQVTSPSCKDEPCTCYTVGDPAFHYGIMEQWFSRLQKNSSLFGVGGTTQEQGKHTEKPGKNIYCLLKHTVDGSPFLGHRE